MLLNCHSYYSLRYGTFSEEALVDLAIEQGYNSVGLTDINTTSGVLSFLRYAQHKQIKGVVGVDFRNGTSCQFVGIAPNEDAYFELNSFLAKHLHEGKAFETKAPAFEHAIVIYPFESALKTSGHSLRANEYIGVSLRELRKLSLNKLIKTPDKLILLQPVSFRSKRDFNTHRLLRAIDNNTLLSKLSSEEQADPADQMPSRSVLYEQLSDVEFLLENTSALIDRCQLDFQFHQQAESQNLNTFTGSTPEDIRLLRRLCNQGLHYRYPEPTEALKQRVEKELSLIEQKQFVSYFLINHDIVTYAQKRGFHYVGRGSGANSVVAYLLRITDVDPLELDLYFERFMNEYRSSPPDFDIDFCWKERNEIIDYIFQRFTHVSLLGSYVTFQKRAVIREIGKVFGLPKDEIDHLVETLRPLSRKHPNESLHQLVLKYAAYIHGLPNYLSIHAGGILISSKPIHRFASTFMPPKGYPTVQFDMHIAEAVGLYKFDILSQRGVSKIQEAIRLVASNQGKTLDIHQVDRFKNDPQLNAYLSRGDCMGCFYIESPAMRMLLQKLETKSYLELVAASSIIRPGVAQSGMMNEYILRHRDKERTRKAHPELLKIMPDTYGVMVYQEDVIKVAHLFAGLSLAEADILRRAMSGKSRSKSEFLMLERSYFEGCAHRGHSKEVAQEVWKQIESFAGYAFAKGHSASYAIESYQTLYLKVYYPLEYMTSVLNNGGGFYSPEFYLKHFEQLGGAVELQCINHSHYLNTLVGKRLYLGLMYLKELEDRSCERILKERQHRGGFKSLTDFIDRVPLSTDQISLLIRSNAFRFTNKTKHELLWQLYSYRNLPAVKGSTRLFPTDEQKFELKHIEVNPVEEVFEAWELLGFPLSLTFELLKTPLPEHPSAKELQVFENRCITLYGYLVTVKNTKTHKGEHMQFATFLDREGRVFDSVSFPDVARKYPCRSKGIYSCYGKVVNSFNHYSIEVIRLERLDYVPDPRYSAKSLAPSPKSSNRMGP
jgi:DNA-directed DNA polymerase III PolC